MTGLILAVDHHLVHQGLRMLLESEPDLQVVGEAGDGQDALRRWPNNYARISSSWM